MNSTSKAVFNEANTAFREYLTSLHELFNMRGTSAKDKYTILMWLGIDSDIYEDFAEGYEQI